MYLWNHHLIDWLNGWITITWLCEVSFDWNSRTKRDFSLFDIKLDFFLRIKLDYWAEVFFSLMLSFLVLRILYPLSVCSYHLDVYFILFWDEKEQFQFCALRISLPSYFEIKKKRAEVFFCLMFSSLVLRMLYPLSACSYLLNIFFLLFEVKKAVPILCSLLSISLPFYKKAKCDLSILLFYIIIWKYLCLFNFV